MSVTRRHATQLLFLGTGAALAGGNCSQPPPTVPPDPGTSPPVDPGPGPVTPPPPSNSVRVRRDATTMSANDPALVAYGEAITRMKALPASDARSWPNQMMIHLNFCPHGNWWFLPWHRAYLHSFEEACRGVLDDDSFALPYWNWSRDGRIPAPFNDPSSPLFQPGRSATAGSAAPPELVGADVVQQQILDEPNFELFGSGRAQSQRGRSGQGPLEAQPHNGIHGFVGGEMGSFRSPLDPVFWLHHANVDRIWSIWNARGNANPADGLWRNLSYTEFADRNGSSITVRTSDMESTEALGYRYDTSAVTQGMGLREPFARLRATTQGTPRLGLLETLADQAKVVIRAGNPARCIPNQVHELSVRARDARAISPTASNTQSVPLEALRAPSRVIARIGDMESPQNQDVVVRVFVNCEYLSPSLPVSDPHYAGSFTFFCGEESDCLSGDLATTKDITGALRAIQGPNFSAEDVRVQLMPVALNGRSLDNADFFARSVEIAAI